MTYWIILVTAIVLSLISLRYRNILFSLGGFLGWLTMWAYHQTNPPLNIVVGSFVHEMMMYVFIIMAIGVMFMYFRNRQRGYTGYAMTKKEEAEAEARVPPRGLMDMSVDEYKAHIRTRVRRRRR